MAIPNQNLINETVVHFSKYRKKPITSKEAISIIVNFNRFANLLIRLDKKKKCKICRKECEKCKLIQYMNYRKCRIFLEKW